jgi:hypothetical protein
MGTSLPLGRKLSSRLASRLEDPPGGASIEPRPGEGDRRLVARFGRWIELCVRRVEHEVPRVNQPREAPCSSTARSEILLQRAPCAGPQVVRGVDQTDRGSHLLTHATTDEDGEVGAEQEIGCVRPGQIQGEGRHVLRPLEDRQRFSSRSSCHFWMRVARSRPRGTGTMASPVPAVTVASSSSPKNRISCPASASARAAAMSGGQSPPPPKDPSTRMRRDRFIAVS